MKKVLIYIDTADDILDEEFIVLTLKIQQAINLGYNLIFYIGKDIHNSNILKDFINTLPTTRYTIITDEKNINYKEVKFSIVLTNIKHMTTKNIFYKIYINNIHSKVYITFNKYLVSYKLNSYRRLKDFYFNFIDKID